MVFLVSRCMPWGLVFFIFLLADYISSFVLSITSLRPAATTPLSDVALSHERIIMNAVVAAAAAAGDDDDSLPLSN